MLFNLVMVPMEIAMILMILKIKNNIKELHFESKVSREHLECFYDLDEEYIEEHNKKYILPGMKLSVFIFLLISIGVSVLDGDMRHIFVGVSFGIYFVINFIYLFLAKKNINKRKIQ